MDLTCLARPGGALAMVAMDQRDSLRTMFKDTGRTAVTDEELIDFKLEVARTLGPHASAFLIDREYGFDRIRDERLVGERTGLILAADALTQETGGPVEDTALDQVVVAPEFDMAGMDAIKLLLIWRDDERRQERVQLARDFADAARSHGVLSVLEPVVRPSTAQQASGDFDRESAIREAARELSVTGQSLYKVQVPLGGEHQGARLDEEMAALDESITGPWVVLSQGVSIANFPGAVESACRHGASGFLAGRALWSDVVGTADLRTTLEQVSLPRLTALGEVVDALARPWNQA